MQKLVLFMNGTTPVVAWTTLPGSCKVFIAQQQPDEGAGEDFEGGKICVTELDARVDPDWVCRITAKPPFKKPGFVIKEAK